MKKACLAVLTILISVLLCNCIQSHTVIDVKKDGSGTIRVTFLITQIYLSMLDSMTAESDADGGDFIDKMINKGDVQNAAGGFGTGVKFVSVEKTTTDIAAGYTALYAFSDINSVNLDQNPMNPDPDADTTSKEMIRFEFKSGNPATLKILVPEEKPDQTGTNQQPATGEEIDDATLEMFSQYWKDMQIRISVKVDGTIRESNATYQDGSEIVLRDIDFGKIVQNKELFRKLMNDNSQSIGQVQDLLLTAPGIKYETNPSLVVTFY